jgi:hypothetical protein
MAWPASPFMASNAITAVLDEFYVLGSGTAGADSDKNLVTSTSTSHTLGGSAAFGSDAIGVYCQVGAASGDYLRVVNALAIGDTDMTFVVVFSRTAAPANYGTLFEQRRNTAGRWASLQVWAGGNETLFNNHNTSVGNNYPIRTVTADTERCVVMTRVGTAGKLFYTGDGGTPYTFTAIDHQAGDQEYIQFGDSVGGGENYPMRIRAYAWANAALSDANASALANDPQGTLLGTAPTGPSIPLVMHHLRQQGIAA